MKTMDYELGDILISKDAIKKRVSELACEIIDTMREPFVFLSILNGSFIFTADLIREFPLSPEVQFLKASSYGSGTVSSGRINIYGKEEIKIKDKNVILVEDIVDTGLTITELVRNLDAFEPKTIKAVTLLDKPDRRKYEFNPDFVGFRIPDFFVVGYGLDYNQKYRGLPDIWNMELSEEK